MTIVDGNDDLVGEAPGEVRGEFDDEEEVAAAAGGGGGDRVEVKSVGSVLMFSFFF